MSFADLGVPDDLIAVLADDRIETPFPVQAATIPPGLAGRDIAARAPTGSGKTLAFGIPLVASVQRARPKRPRALVLVPTRELAAQVSRDLGRLGAIRDVRVDAFYGGAKFEPQVKALRRGVDIAVACPGRLTDLIDQGIARLDGVDLIVVDEADRMADMGFLPEVRALIDQTNAGRQTLLFSATLDGDVDALISRYQHDPIRIDVTPETPSVQINHYFWSVPHARRISTTAAIIDRVGPTVVFTRTRFGADRVAVQLGQEGIEAVAIHGNRTQAQRDQALRLFRSGRAQALVATDVAARGIHVDDVSCVVHFDLPTDPKDYVHRSGRTGRAGAMGVVVALAMPDRRKATNALLKVLPLDVEVTDPHLDVLPISDLRPVKPARKSDRERPGDTSDRGRGKSSSQRHAKHGDHHKPTGRRTKPRPSDPDDTPAARKKRVGPGPGNDPDSRGTKAPSKSAAKHGAKPDGPKKPKKAKKKVKHQARRNKTLGAPKRSKKPGGSSATQG